VYDSLLSEYAACGFEYGYSVAAPSALVIWEAQFGDFANGAQIIFDQFLSAAGEKWGQESSLVLLLPHGYEGQGPEHSSARLERFLQLCAEDNMIVCNLTTPASLFHALRRQVRLSPRKPLVVMSPKSLLRHPMAVSSPADFVDATFRDVIPSKQPVEQVRRHIFCSGKVYYELAAEIEKTGIADVAVTRLEQIHPFPAESIRSELERFDGARSIAWLQEEPQNMGAWTFVSPRFDALVAQRSGDPCRRIAYVGRAASASTSTGSAKVHQFETEEILTRAIGE
jgi:2-oxoglutarate dehydrogenase E1 component